MKAFVVGEYGPDGLHAAEGPEPTLGGRGVPVEVAAASINPLDTMIRNGEFELLLPYRRPFTLAHDVAGVVAAVGAEVTGYVVGDERRGTLEPARRSTPSPLSTRERRIRTPSFA